MPFVSRTRAIFRSAEFGFFGVIVETRVQTPRRCGAPWSAGVLVLSRLVARPLRMSWLTVGIGSVVTDERPAGSVHPAEPAGMVAGSGLLAGPQTRSGTGHDRR